MFSVTGDGVEPSQMLHNDVPFGLLPLFLKMLADLFKLAGCGSLVDLVAGEIVISAMVHRD